MTALKNYYLIWCQCIVSLIFTSLVSTHSSVCKIVNHNPSCFNLADCSSASAGIQMGQNSSVPAPSQADTSPLYPRRVNCSNGELCLSYCASTDTLSDSKLHAFPDWYCLEAEQLSFINGQQRNLPNWSTHCWRVIRDCDKDKAVGDWAEETHTTSKNSLCHVTTCSFDIWIYGLNHKWPKASFIWTQDRNNTCPTELSFTFPVLITKKTEQALQNLGAFGKN